MYYRIIVGLVTVVAASLAQAGAVPEPIKAQYKGMAAAAKGVNQAAFMKVYAKDAVFIGKDGKPRTLIDATNEYKRMFSDATKIDFVPNLQGSTTSKDLVNVQFKVDMKVTGKTMDLTVKEVGVDTWKKIGKEWLIVKTKVTDGSVLVSGMKGAKVKPSGSAQPLRPGKAGKLD